MINLLYNIFKITFKYNLVMKAIITNKITLIKNPSTEIIHMLNNLLSYEDKAVKYQLMRMEKNPYQRNSSLYKKLQKEVNCTLLKNVKAHLAFNSGLFYMIEGSISDIEDRRCDTGKQTSFPWKKKPLPLRGYQQEAVDLCLNNWRGIVNFATGMGKTLTAVHLIRELKRKTLIVVPSDSIAKQMYTELITYYGEERVGFYGGGKKNIKDITIGIAASIVKVTKEFKRQELGCVIFDEVHHIAASTFFSIASDLGDVGRIYGLTATDYRSDGKDIMINAGCGPVIIKRDIKWGIDNKFLAKPKFIIKKIPTSGIDYKNDKIKSYKEHVLGSSLMKAQILNDIQQAIAAGKSVLCLVDEVAHGEELSRQTGLPFAQGKDKSSNKYVEDLNNGKISGLIGTDGRIGEGTDTKRVDVLILANFVASKGPVIQCIGRGLRIYGTKQVCEIYDYVPSGSTMLKRHAESRIGFYREISDDILVV